MAAERALRQQRDKLVKEMRALLDSATGRQLTEDESSNYDALGAKLTPLLADIQRREALSQIELEARDLTDAALESIDEQEDGDDVVTPEFRALADFGGDRRALEAWEMTQPVPEVRCEEDRIAARNSPRYRAEFRHFLLTGKMTTPEARALSVTPDADGGNAVADEQFARGVIQALDDMLFIRQISTGTTLDQAKSLGVPQLDVDPDDADWTSELLTGSEDSAMAFEKRVFSPHPLAKRLKVSKLLLRISSVGIDALVRQRLAYKIAVPQEAAYMTGDGSGKPLGVFTEDASGVPAGRNVVIGASGAPATFSFDGLKAAKWNNKEQYVRRSSWVYHRDIFFEISKLRTDSGAGAGTGNYLWQPSNIAGEPDRLLGQPIFISEYAPSDATGSGNAVGMFGDFSFYWYMDALNLQIQVLLELYAETNQIGYITRYEGDGMPVLGEAFTRCTLS